MNLEFIIQECKKGRPEAQKRLFERQARLMMAVCIRYVKQWEDAEELMLNGFQKFFKNIDQFNYLGEGSVVAYLKKIMVNECLAFLRKRNTFHITTTTIEEFTLEQQDALDKLSAEEILKMITQLPEGYRTVFNLYVMENMAHKEIAQLLKISEGTSKSQLSKARIQLQKIILKNKNE